MNHISKTIYGRDKAVDLEEALNRHSRPSDPDDRLTEACVDAIDQAVRNLKSLMEPEAAPAQSRALTPDQVAAAPVMEMPAAEKIVRQETPVRGEAILPAAARSADDRLQAGAALPLIPELKSEPVPAEPALRRTEAVVEPRNEPSIRDDDSVARVHPIQTPAVDERPRRAEDETPVLRDAPLRQPENKIEPKTAPIPTVGRIIDNEPGPMKENELRPRAGGGGNDKDRTPDKGGGGGGGGGNDSGMFHKRSNGPVNFALSLRNGIAAVRRNIAIVMIFTIAINVLVLAIPLYLFQISDRVLTSRSIDTLIMLTVAVVGAVLLQAFMDTVRRFILMRTAVELEVQLGAPILSAAARASLHGNGKDYQILQDLQQLRSFLTSGTLIAFLDAPLMPLFVLVVYFVHPHLGIIIMACCAVLFVIAYLNQKFTAKQFGEANGYLSRANFHLDSMTRNSQIINALAMIPEAVKMWGRETAGSLKSQVAAQDRNIIFSGLSKACRMITQIALLGWGAHLSLSGQLTGGMVIAASIVSGRALAPIEGAIEGWNQFSRSALAYGRIKQLLLNSPLNFPRLRLPNPEGRLDVERLLFVPPPQKRVILNGISFSLKKGEALAVIGNSGSGKTTLGKMLVGSVVPTSGSVRLDLMDLRNWDQRQFGESIGYLPQDVQLFPGTIKANICRMRDDVEDHLIYDAAILADVHELIATFPQGYETVVAADGAPLSGGQKQRIALARAFFGNPKFVVLDEPNSNLDTNGEAALARAIMHAKKQGITTVTITQRPSLLQCVDKIMVLKEGFVAMFGERMEVLQALKGKPDTASGQAQPKLEG